MSSGPIVDFGSLQAAIVDWLKRGDLGSNQAAQFIQLSEAEFNARIRAADMETRAFAQISPLDSEPGYLAMPDDFLELRDIWLDLTTTRKHQLTYATPSMLDKMNPGGVVGMPNHFTFEGNAFRFDKQPDITYQVTIDYYARIAALNAANTTNWLLRKWPSIYLYQSLMHSAPYLKGDQRLQTWKVILQGTDEKSGLYSQIERADRNARWNAPAMERRRAIVISDGMRRRR